MTDALHAGLRVHTPDGVVSWQELWAGVEPQLRRIIRRRTDAHSVDDILQDVVLKLVASDREIDSVSGFERWCTRITTNHLSDEREKRARMIAGVPDIVDVVDVADEVLHKVEADKVLGQVARLSPADRHALVADGKCLTRAAQNKLNVQRHRARMRLAKLLAGVAGVLGLRRSAKVLLPALSLVVLCLALPLVTRPVEGDARPGAPLERVEASQPSPSEGAAAPIASAGAGGGSAPTSASTASAAAPSLTATSTTRPGQVDVYLPDAAVTKGPVPIAVTTHHAPPPAADGRPVLTCGDDPITGHSCIYYPIALTLPNTIDPEDPLALLPQP